MVYQLCRVVWIIDTMPEFFQHSLWCPLHSFLFVHFSPIFTGNSISNVTAGRQLYAWGTVNGNKEIQCSMWGAS